jgi:hypothetical protein
VTISYQIIYYTCQRGNFMLLVVNTVPMMWIQQCPNKQSISVLWNHRHPRTSETLLLLKTQIELKVILKIILTLNLS